MRGSRKSKRQSATPNTGQMHLRKSCSGSLSAAQLWPLNYMKSFSQQALSLADRGFWVLLAANEAKTRRERLTLVRIFETLRDVGFDGSYDAVRRYARNWGKARHGVSHTSIEEPRIQLVKALDPHSWRKEAFADQAHLVLDLPLLPARRRRARHRLHQAARLR